MTRLELAMAAMDPATRKEFQRHLHGGTSADWLSRVLEQNGFQVSATSIRVYRRALQS